ncbi:MAG: pantoate--beta-alanine ligase [Candidatus Saganbacteria bacterium]|nr:pantoate--beta-alanine ligase [Candidatus Saganbacteria bacterium]
MQTITDIKKMKSFIKEARKKGKTIGFVPTMGYLHSGHLSLVSAAKKSSDVVVVSIFVNPLQFGPKEDLKKYPRDLERDKKLLAPLGIDVIFSPTAEEMFPPDFSCYAEETKLSKGLCGKKRPGHFKGVITVVLKLFQIIKPDIAFFGAKDWQQQSIIRKKVKDFHLDVEINTLPTVREEDEVAMSSRNSYLSKKERKASRILYQTLCFIKEMAENDEKDIKKILKNAKKLLKSEPLFKLEYLEMVDPETLDPKDTADKPLVALIAGFIGKTRLIDNILIR